MDWRRNGYFPVWRSIWESGDFTSLPGGDHRMIMVAILSEANWEPRTVACSKCGRPIELDAGDAWINLSMLARQAQTTRDIARTAVKRLSRSGFISTKNTCHHHTVYRINNRPKFHESISVPHGCSTDTPQLPHGCATPTPHHRRKRKEDKKERSIEEPSAGLLIADPSMPTATELALADQHRQLHIAHGGTGVKRDDLWQRDKRGAWAREYTRQRGEYTAEQFQAAMAYAYGDTSPWASGTRGWRAVLLKAKSPARTLVGNMAALVAQSAGGGQLDDPDLQRESDEDADAMGLPRF